MRPRSVTPAVARRTALALLVALVAACDTVPPPPFAGPSGDATTRVDGEVVALAGVCDPGDTAFCHYNGRCDATGAGCVCDDPAHFTPEDDCHLWRQVTTPVEGSCAPGDRDYCHSNGRCDPDGEACICDDPEHFTPDDECSTWHQTTAVPDPDQRCVPGTRDLCHHNGVCDADGLLCVCDDPEHFWPDDDCNTWHQGPVPDEEPSPEATTDAADASDAD